MEDYDTHLRDRRSLLRLFQQDRSAARQVSRITIDYAKLPTSKQFHPNVSPGGLQAAFWFYGILVGPGLTDLYLTALPANAYIASIWMSESTPDGNRPFFASATVQTSSVQAEESSGTVRVRFSHDWQPGIYVGAQIMYGFH